MPPADFADEEFEEVVVDVSTLRLAHLSSEGLDERVSNVRPFVDDVLLCNEKKIKENKGNKVNWIAHKNTNPTVKKRQAVRFPDESNWQKMLRYWALGK